MESLRDGILPPIPKHLKDAFCGMIMLSIESSLHGIISRTLRFHDSTRLFFARQSAELVCDEVQGFSLHKSWCQIPRLWAQAALDRFSRQLHRAAQSLWSALERAHLKGSRRIRSKKSSAHAEKYILFQTHDFLPYNSLESIAVRKTEAATKRQSLSIEATWRPVSFSVLCHWRQFCISWLQFSSNDQPELPFVLNWNYFSESIQDVQDLVSWKICSIWNFSWFQRPTNSWLQQSRCLWMRELADEVNWQLLFRMSRTRCKFDWALQLGEVTEREIWCLKVPHFQNIIMDSTSSDCSFWENASSLSKFQLKF